MIDISTELVASAGSRRDRWSDESAALLALVAHACAGSVNWDDDAGEDWGTIVVQSHAAAHVYMQAPLIMADSEYERAILCQRSLVLHDLAR